MLLLEPQVLLHLVPTHMDLSSLHSMCLCMQCNSVYIELYPFERHMIDLEISVIGQGMKRGLPLRWQLLSARQFQGHMAIFIVRAWRASI